jgi:hypothetical protein
MHRGLSESEYPRIQEAHSGAPMKKPTTVKALEDFGRTRLSPSFFMRDFLHSEIANLHGMPNIPDDPDLAIDVGTHLCGEILEPLQRHSDASQSDRRSARARSTNSATSTATVARRNETSYGAHIWDRRNAAGHKGAMACVAVPSFTDFLVERRRLARNGVVDSRPPAVFGGGVLSGARRVQHQLA